jgi:hypothetical protein
VYESSDEFESQGESKLLRDLNHLSDGNMISSDEEALLPLVVSAALEGIDVAMQFPGFYRKFLASSALREAFLDALRSLEDEKLLPQQAQLPGGQWKYTELLQVLVKPLVEQFAPYRWRVTWQRGSTQLQEIFFPASASAAYRSEEMSLEDIIFPLLRSQAELANLRVDLLLQAVQKVESPDLLYLIGLVQFQSTLGGSQFEIASPITTPGVRLHIQWGSYQAVADTDAQGQAIFPPLPWNEVLDVTSERVIAAFSLSLESPPNETTVSK